MTPHNQYEFGPYQLDLTRRVLSCDGETISLTPKATDILIKLVTNAGQVVEKDQLLKEVWPNTFVEEANLSQNIFTLRKALRDDRNEPKYIKTVAKRGYRFVANVSARRIEGHKFGVLAETGQISNDQYFVVAVLPFLNTTGNSELEYLVEGITDNLINCLSRISKLRVMSHSAIAPYKTRDLSPQEVARELGATVVLVGKLGRRPAGITVGVELVDASTGWQLWGENFDSERNDLLQIQDAITHRLLATLKLTLTSDEQQQITVRYTENAKAYQSYLEGRYHWSSYTRIDIEKAIGHFQQAIDHDPNYALAYAGIVDCYLRLGLSLAVLIDEMSQFLETEERTNITAWLTQIVLSSEELSIHGRLQEALQHLLPLNTREP